MFLFALAVIAGPLVLFTYSPDFMDATYDFGLVRCLYGFSAGVLTQALLAGKIDSGPKTREALWTWTFAELTVIGAVILFVSTAAANAGGLLAPLMFAFAVALFAHEGGYVSRLMKTRPLLLLGTISYSIYLTHIFVQSRLMNAAKIVENRFVEGILTDTRRRRLLFLSRCHSRRHADERADHCGELCHLPPDRSAGPGFLQAPRRPHPGEASDQPHPAIRRQGKLGVLRVERHI